MNYVFILVVVAITFDKCYLYHISSLFNYPLCQYGLGLYLNVLPICWFVSNDWKSALGYTFLFSFFVLLNLYLLFSFLVQDYLYEHRFHFVDVVVPR